MREGQTCWQPDQFSDPASLFSFSWPPFVPESFSLSYILIQMWGLSCDHRAGKKLWDAVAMEKAISSGITSKETFCYPPVLCTWRGAAYSLKQRGRPKAPGVWEISAGHHGPFEYEQVAAFAASHITHRKLSGNISSEQNTVLNEAWSSIIGHPGEALKWWLTIKNK